MDWPTGETTRDITEIDSKLRDWLRKGYSKDWFARKFKITEQRVQEAINRIGRKPTPDSSPCTIYSPRTDIDVPQFRKLVNGAVRAYCKKRRNWTPEDREDLTQEAMIAALDAHNRFDRTRNVPYAAWIRSKLDRPLFDAGRKLLNRGMTWVPRKNYAPPDFLDYSALANDVSGDGMGDGYDDDDERTSVRDALQVACPSRWPDDIVDCEKAVQLLSRTMNAADMRLLRQKYSEEETDQKIANELGKSRPTISKRISNRTARAKAILEASGVRQEDFGSCPLDVADSSSPRRKWSEQCLQQHPGLIGTQPYGDKLDWAWKPKRPSPDRPYDYRDLALKLPRIGGPY